jgi:hypothetical protein
MTRLSPQILALRASTNNRATTLLEIFLQAIAKYGVPLRVRGDRGGENIEVSVWMVVHRGPNRGSFLWGSYVLSNNLDLVFVLIN